MKELATCLLSRYLRLNFITPNQPCLEDQGASSLCIKEMLYRSHEARRLTATYRMIQELRKRFRQHVAKLADAADLVAQETLVRILAGGYTCTLSIKLILKYSKLG